MPKWIVVATIAAVATVSGAQDRPLPPAGAFLAQARLRLRSDRTLLSQYTYLMRTRVIHVSKLGKLEQGPEHLVQVYPGLRSRDNYQRLIAVDGQPRDPAQLASDDQKHQKRVVAELAKRQRESPADREKRLRLEAKEARDEAATIDDVFRIFDFQLVERQPIEGHSTIVVAFTPRPDAEPRTDAGKVLKKTKGRAWVSEDDFELARIEAEVLDDIPLGMFLLKFYKGTTLAFDRRKVNDEVWLPAQARISLSGRALVRKFRIDTVIQYSDYRKFSVETDTVFKVPG